MIENLSNIYGDPCANKWGARKNFLYSLPELGKLNFYVHLKLHVLVMDHNNHI